MGWSSDRHVIAMGMQVPAEGEDTSWLSALGDVFGLWSDHEEEPTGTSPRAHTPVGGSPTAVSPAALVSHLHESCMSPLCKIMRHMSSAGLSCHTLCAACMKAARVEVEWIQLCKPMPL